MRVVSKPAPSDVVVDKDGRPTPVLQTYHDDIEKGLNSNLLGAAVALPSYTVLTLPIPAATNLRVGDTVFVTDDVGGPTPAWFNGTNFLRYRDNVVVS